jgi:hypothetical protein
VGRAPPSYRFYPISWDIFCRVPSRIAGAAMTTVETDFAYRIDRWDTYGGNIIHHIANMNDLELAMVAYEAACKLWPEELITLRQGARIIKATRIERQNT